jgi:hypothetical protein
MSAEAAAAVRTWAAGRYLCTLTVARPKPGAVVQCCVEWEPEQPRRLTEAELREYRAGRNAALQSIAAELGLSTAVVEL